MPRDHPSPFSSPPALRLRAALPWTGLAAVALLAVTLLGLLLLASPSLLRADQALVRTVNDVHSPAADALARAIDVGLGPLGSAILFALLVALSLARHRCGRDALWTAAVIGLPWLAAQLVKQVVRRDRPDLADLLHVLVTQPHSTSFPSGHTAFAAALACALVLALPRGRGRRLAVAGGVLFVLLVAWSRVALGMHHVSDVTASILLVPVIALCTARTLAALGLSRSSGSGARSVPRPR
ncbi:phosphatase PAP2 family protein [Brachybacterium hainanense]|uniref:Phosphatase PAP2 family protein n=1 Tax=Brachybacterium hainanense TaxID=1541174 RepID=A0ABV6R9S8_9MICO